MSEKVADIAAARFRKYIRDGTFAIAAQVEIEKFEPELIDDFLDRVFGVRGAFVTDESRLSDFISFGKDPRESAEAVTKIQEDYGITVDIHDRLFEVLRRLV